MTELFLILSDGKKIVKNKQKADRGNKIMSACTL